VEIGTALFWQEKHSEVQGYLRSSNGAFAAAAPIATPLTQPATESVEGENAFTGSAVIIAILAVAAVGAGIYVAVDNDDEDLPTSP
jgi:hypothetical protein